MDFPENITSSKSRGIFCAKDRFLNQKQVPTFFVFDAVAGFQLGLGSKKAKYSSMTADEIALYLPV